MLVSEITRFQRCPRQSMLATLMPRKRDTSNSELRKACEVAIAERAKTILSVTPDRFPFRCWVHVANNTVAVCLDWCFISKANRLSAVIPIKSDSLSMVPHDVRVVAARLALIELAKQYGARVGGLTVLRWKVPALSKAKGLTGAERTERALASAWFAEEFYGEPPPAWAESDLGDQAVRFAAETRWVRHCGPHCGGCLWRVECEGDRVSEPNDSEQAKTVEP